MTQAPRTSYRLHFPSLHAHLIDVEARFSSVALPIDLHMAVWTPGSYLVRDYARYVQDVTAQDETGSPLPVSKVDKTTWRVGGSARDVVVKYRVYGWDLTVRTNHVDGTHAFVNGAPTYLWMEERRGEPAEVVVDPPPGWTFTTGLRGGPHRFDAADLDELIDSPLLGLPSAPIEFTAAGKSTTYAVWGRADAGVATVDQLVSDTRTIIEAYAELFGGVPYDRYAFLLMLAPESYGGLEHKSSTGLLASPFHFATRKKYDELLELVSHEYFHLWNVKRIRPKQLGPFDYLRENHTRALWVAEGLTSYYDRYTLRRTRLQTVKRYLEKLAEEWGRYVMIPGRFKQSMEESSFDSWIKLYRPDENSVNSTVSYYLKGGLVTLCLDLEIRKRSGGKKSLDDVLRHLWRTYGVEDRGFDDTQVQQDFEAAVGLELSDSFTRYVRGREDPALVEHLAAFGLELRPKPEKPNGEEKNPGWLGINTRSDGPRFLVANTLSGSPAEAAGLYAGDELLALDGWRLDDRSFGDRISSHKPNERIRLTIFRNSELREVEVTLGAKPKDTFEIIPIPTADDEAKALCRNWLGEDALPSG
jgi:predicted metalloprotease with PDZ domain